MDASGYLYTAPTIPHINSETNPLPPIINVVRKYQAQASVLIFFQDGAISSRGKGLDLFQQSRPFRNFHKFFQELTWSQ